MRELKKKTGFSYRSYIEADNMMSYISTFFGRKEYCVVWIVISGGVMCREIVMIWLLWTQFLIIGIPLVQAEVSVRNLRKINVPLFLWAKAVP